MPTLKNPDWQSIKLRCDGETPEEELMMREVISRMADKWSLWALAEIVADGPLRFSRIMERVEGVSQKSLTSALRHLERDGLITRTVTVQVPIRVDYEATQLGHEMVAHAMPLCEWTMDNVKNFAAARRRYDKVKKGNL